MKKTALNLFSILSGLLIIFYPFFVNASIDIYYDWTYSIGGTQDEEIRDIVIDSSGNVYFVGYFKGTVDFNPTGGIDSHTSAGDRDIFLTKINSNGSYGYTYSIGNTGKDDGMGIAVDDSDNVYITGQFSLTVDFNPTGGTDNHASNGGQDIFLTKINSDATYGYTYTVGGNSLDEPSEITLDSLNNIYISGYFYDTVDFNPTGGTDNHASNGENDSFLLKINSDQTYGYAYTIGGLNFDGGSAVDCDSSNNVYISGYFTGFNIDLNPTAGIDNHTSNGNRDGFYTKINSDGTYGYSYSFGGSSADGSSSIVLDSSDNIYITGGFFGTADLDPTAGTENHTSSGSADFYLIKINSDDSFNFAYTFGGTEGDYCYKAEIDSHGNMYLVGGYQGTADFDPTAGTDNHTAVAWYDAYLVRIEADGSYGGMYNFGGIDTDIAYATAINSSGTFYIGGYFMETADFDPGTGTENHTSNGGYDIFLSKYSIDSAPPIINSVNLSEGQVISGSYHIETYAEDAKSGVKKVEFFIDDSFRSEDYNNPAYDYEWDTTGLADGSYRVGVVAYDNQNNMAQVTYNVLVANRSSQVSVASELPQTGSDLGNSF
ncbi:MAG: Ig-like domain-containing protein [Candidatus Berkelbacteria bacterium]|nr:Ig-like domain-containing protein [Candidatus Berkelbacteria bacterium]